MRERLDLLVDDRRLFIEFPKPTSRIRRDMAVFLGVVQNRCQFRQYDSDRRSGKRPFDRFKVHLLLAVYDGDDLLYPRVPLLREARHKSLYLFPRKLIEPNIAEFRKDVVIETPAVTVDRWLLAGMDAHSKLDSVDSDPSVLEIARRHLSHDPHVTFRLMDGEQFLAEARTQYDLIFADAWAGKYNHLDEALSLLPIGGIYLIDDLLPQPNWPEDHAPKVPVLIKDLESRQNFEVTKLEWASGLMVVVRTAP
jgi:hypothetical protein